MGDFSAYVSLCLQNGWLYLAFVPFILDAVGRLAVPGVMRKIDRRFPSRFRKECEVVLIGLGLFYAGFSAYDAEHLQRQQAEKDRDAAFVQSAQADQTAPADQDQAAQLRAKADALAQKAAEQNDNVWPALTDDQINEWAEQLAPYKVTFVSIAYGDENSRAFRESLAKAFVKAKWPAPLMMTGGGGLGITFKSMDDLPAAPVVQTLFQSICTQVKWDASTDPIAGVQITIGQKPISNSDAPAFPSGP